MLEEIKAWKNLEERKQYRKLEAGGNNSLFLPHWALNAAPSCSQGTSTEDESVWFFWLILTAWSLLPAWLYETGPFFLDSVWRKKKSALWGRVVWDLFYIFTSRCHVAVTWLNTSCLSLVLKDKMLQIQTRESKVYLGVMLCTCNPRYGRRITNPRPIWAAKLGSVSKNYFKGYESSLVANCLLHTLWAQSQTLEEHRFSQEGLLAPSNDNEIVIKEEDDQNENILAIWKTE